jgi:glycyl-tRNA synthetase beta subunit
LHFVNDRFHNLLKEQYDYSVLKSVIDVSDLTAAKQKLDAIKEHYADQLQQDNFNALKRLLRFESAPTGDVIHTESFVHSIEFELYDMMNGLKNTTLEALLKIAPVVNQYFDKVIINDINDAIRTNRHNLIYMLQAKVRSYADFSALGSVK